MQETQPSHVTVYLPPLITFVDTDMELFYMKDQLSERNLNVLDPLIIQTEP